jgi:glycosyltransferase involved in cell wall biosynthesis
VAIALLTNYLAPYRIPLYERLANSFGVEVLCFGGGERYVPSWFADLDAQLARAPFPARRLEGGPAEALKVAGDYETVIAPFAGGAVLPAAYAGARLRRRAFILWASVWAEPRSPAHAVARPATHHIYRHADAVIAYGEHVRRFVARVRGRDDDVFVAPQSVEAELFARHVDPVEIVRFRRHHDLPDGPVALYVGRLVPEKGVDSLLEAWRALDHHATLALIGDGPLADHVADVPSAMLLGPRPRQELPVAYATADFTILASVPTRRFREPWGLVCNEAMHQGKPVIASDAVGAVAGGLVRDDRNGLVIPAGDVEALKGAIDRLLADHTLREGLGARARLDVAPYNYDAMLDAFGHALERAAR